MKPVGRHLHFVVFVFILTHAITASAITFTSDTYIGPNDPSYDGQDIIVTNCTLTVDGVHGFNSLQILNGGILSHSAFTNGPLQFTNFVSDENQILSTTNAATLNNPNVDTNSIVVMDSTATITYTPDVDYLITVTNQFTQLTLTATSSIPQGATVLVSYDWAQDYLGLSLTISNDMDVALGGSVDLSGMGYAGGNGFGNGAGTTQVGGGPVTVIIGGGGGHGGGGGMANAGFVVAAGGVSYDSTTTPANVGSGGGSGEGSGGAGGGLGQFFIGGTLQIDGQILADGLAATNGNAGGGAGGGLLLSAQTFSGAGTISARGGNENSLGIFAVGGGGGGGIIAIDSATNTYTGTIVAYGGIGDNYGGAGTIFTTSLTNGPGQLLIADNDPMATNHSPFFAPGTTIFLAPAISNLTISGGAIAQPTNSTFAISNLVVGSNSTLLSPVSAALTFTVNGNATVQSNAFIDADSQSLSGPGAGNSSCGAGSGGAYGGNGGSAVCGSAGGSTYDYPYYGPVSLGSPGGGSPTAFGGGAINLTVSGMLSLAGQISANGAGSVATNGGGGSGGSVFLTVGTISGGGTIAANGGAANNSFGGGGGGGAVAVVFGTNLFTGPITAYGGNGANAGGAGSVYLLTNSFSIGQLTFDNAGLDGLTTPSLSIPQLADLTIRNGAVLAVTGTVGGFRNLFIGSNSFIVGVTNSSAALTALEASNAIIQYGGGIALNGSYIGGAAGGQSVDSTGGGGGNAGYGGMSASNALGGLTTTGFPPPGIGDATLGSMGGAGANGLGGGGGGNLQFIIYDTLQLDGTIAANGGTSASLNSGGGGGGGVGLRVENLVGTGTISANGAAANNLGGGGGGGTIVIYYETNSFSGNITAYGGTGANYGGAGTVFQDQISSINGGGKPLAQQVLVDNGGAPPGTNTLLQFANFISTGVFDLIIRGGASVLPVDIQDMTNGNLTIGSNSVLLARGTPVLAVLTNATIQAGGAIRDDGQGASSLTAGHTLSSTGGGGGYGGIGGNSALNAQGGGVIVDSYASPSSAGAAGGLGSGPVTAGGNGGGSLRLIINGALQLDGIISSQGVTGPGTNSGGGSGGSIWLSAGIISGAGTISVNGGAANGSKGGGGGGGRIALDYNTNSFTGNLTAYGGAGANYGGAGTIYTSSSFAGAGAFTSMVVDNGGTVGQGTLLNGISGISLSSCTIKGGGIMGLTNAGVEGVGGANATFGNLLIGSNSTLNFSGYPLLAVQTNATVQLGGVITSPAFGTFSGLPDDGGSSVFFTGGGGGHGGYGGYGSYPVNQLASGGSVTDSIVAPTLAGGNGGGFSEGGLGGSPLKVVVSGTLELDGICSANGGASTVATNGGGGAGGALWIVAGQLLGAGGISANGAPGTNFGGGGGGGRIAIWANTNSFAGSITAHGGAGVQHGGPGTIYFNSSISGGGRSSQLVIDSGGSTGTNAGINTLVNGVDVLVTNGAGLGIGVAGNMTWNSLTIASNSSLQLVPGSTNINLTINSNLIVLPTGSIDLDGQGFAHNAGPGQGIGVGGGGHGGFGSAGASFFPESGLSYDSITAPVALGSGGGASTSPGSAGGGALELNVSGLLDVDGIISANGQNGAAPQNSSVGGGGGAGGSLWLNAATISGAGTISATGGNGYLTNGGGGGGGRIAIYFNSNTFTGTFSAHGGSGIALPGGAGTIFLETNSIGVGQLNLDNGGLFGTATPLDSLTQTLALSISNGAIAGSGTPLTLQRLSIGSNTLFTASFQTSLVLTVLSDAFIDTNAAIMANGTGYNPGSGPGSGGVDSSGDGSGGGYGGVGGASLFGAPGGVTYGSSNQPVDFGSPGGASNLIAGLSPGGGAIRLVIDGNLTVNGSVSANGNDAFADNAGGGSGGSIWITAQSLAGNGSLTANGGMGNAGQGGGGGGGRIAVYASANSFSGGASVAGGNGAFPGQAGTIVIATNLLVSGSVTDTNGVGITGVTLQPSGLAAVTTDSSGSYSVATPLFWTGTVAPTGAGFFVPNQRNYSNLAANASNQNYLLALPSDFNISSSSFDGTNLNFSWYGINGVTYQPLYSSNLVNWLPYGPPFIGSNAPMTFALPVSTAPQLFFRLGVSY